MTKTEEEYIKIPVTTLKYGTDRTEMLETAYEIRGNTLCFIIGQINNHLLSSKYD